MSFYSVAEILALNLPYLPKTKPSILTKAKKEHWKSQERTGRGGVLLTFEVPAHYLTGGSAPTYQKLTLYAAQQAAAQAYKMSQIVGGVDVDKFVEMFTTLCKTEQEPQPSMNANTIRAQAKAGKNAVIQQGDGNNINVNKIKGNIKL